MGLHSGRWTLSLYVNALSKQLFPSNVLFESRITNVVLHAVYLRSRNAVAEAVSKSFSNDGSFLQLSPLNKPTTRITLSNVHVYPEVPNSVLATNISSFCKVVSQI